MSNHTMESLVIAAKKKGIRIYPRRERREVPLMVENMAKRKELRVIFDSGRPVGRRNIVYLDRVVCCDFRN